MWISFIPCFFSRNAPPLFQLHPATSPFLRNRKWRLRLARDWRSPLDLSAPYMHTYLRDITPPPPPRKCGMGWCPGAKNKLLDWLEPWCLVRAVQTELPLDRSAGPQRPTTKDVRRQKRKHWRQRPCPARPTAQRGRRRRRTAAALEVLLHPSRSTFQESARMRTEAARFWPSASSSPSWPSASLSCVCG